MQELQIIDNQTNKNLVINTVSVFGLGNKIL